MTTAVVWSLPDCVWCDRAKKLLETQGIAYEERLIGSGWTREQLLESVPGARSAPQIFLNDQHVGGFKELERILQETAQ